MLLSAQYHKVKFEKGMNSSNRDKSRFLSHLSANNAVASKSRDLRRSRSYSSNYQREAEGGASIESVADNAYHESRIAQQQRAGLQSSCLSDEEKESLEISLERISSSEKGIGKI